VLQADGRISNLKLAEAVHLSPTAVLERVKRLTRDGYILGYEARLNPAKLGAGLLVFVEVLLDRTVHDVMDNFRAAVQVRPEILEAHLVAGGFDYLLKTRVADMAAYRAVHRQRDLDAARRARDPHLRGDGRGEEQRADSAVVSRCSSWS
jgi:Lrp/AsnC family leucine-responsive transcriptional regulator